MFELPDHLHPMVVHFPIALFITALGVEILSFVVKKESLHRTALHIYIIAVLVTPLVVRTGIWEVEKIHLKHHLLDQHRMFSLLTMWVSLISLPVLYVLKTKSSKYLRIIFVIFLLTIAGLIATTAEKGGRMVYEYAVGVEE